MSKSVIAGLYDKCMFNFVSSLQTILQSVCATLCSHQPDRRDPVSQHPQHLVFSLFFCLAVLVGAVIAT